MKGVIRNSELSNLLVRLEELEDIFSKQINNDFNKSKVRPRKLSTIKPIYEQVNLIISGQDIKC